MRNKTWICSKSRGWIQQCEFRPGSPLRKAIYIFFFHINFNIMQDQKPVYSYDPNQVFTYPFTLISNPKKIFISKPIAQPYFYQVYCPISCKKVRIGAARLKEREAIEFNTTSNRLVTVHLDQTIKYLVNKFPPNKKDKKKVQGKQWSIFLDVQDKGNFAILNPYCLSPESPLSFYMFGKIPKVEKPKQITGFKLFQANQIQQVRALSHTVYLNSSESGTYLSYNKFFEDKLPNQITVVNPNNQSEILSTNPKDFKALIDQNLHFWYNQLQKVIEAENHGILKEQVQFNLDEIYEKLTYFLNLHEQLRARLMNSQGIKLYNDLFEFHPRLYSQFSRLTSFLNYGNTKYEVLKLAQLGFYNKSDMLQDLAFVENSDIPIPTAEEPQYSSEENLREKCFPLSRLNRNLPFPNVPLETTLKSLHYQTVSHKKIIKHQVQKDYITFLDENLELSVWSAKVLPIKLFHFNLTQILGKQENHHIIIDQKEIIKEDQEDQTLNSLFGTEPDKKEADKPTVPIEIVPDQNMLEQMVSMGYNASLVKKALLTVKNESVVAALDALEQIVGEEKKKKAEKAEKKVKKQWNCISCTFFNKAEADTCEICGELNDTALEEEKQRERQEQEAQRLRIQLELKLQQQAQEKKANQLKIKEEEEKKVLQDQEAKINILRQSEVTSIKLIFNTESYVDPFFAVIALWNEQNQKSVVKIVRVGLNRKYLLKFYRVQIDKLISNTTRNIYENTFEGLNQIVKQSFDVIEWGVRTLESSTGHDWTVIQLKELQFGERITDISSNANTLIFKGTKTTYYKIQTKDKLEETKFQLQQIAFQNVIVPPKAENKESNQEINRIEFKSLSIQESVCLNEKINVVHVQIVEELPANVWKNLVLSDKTYEVETKIQGQLVMNDFLPLTIEHYEGSVFSGKHYSTSILQKNNLYISNYPTTNFTMKNIAGKQMLIESVVIISSSKRLQKVYPIYEGLIFTANELTWFHLAKNKFAKFTKLQYQDWLRSKNTRADHREFWEPVGFFQIENQTEIQLDYKRTAKYVFFLPTNIKSVIEKKDEVYAVKIDFFGVKGRLEEKQQKVSSLSNYKNQGMSGCHLEIKRKDGKGEEDSHNIVIKKSSNVNSFNVIPKFTDIYEKIPLSVTTRYDIKIRNSQHEKILRVQSKYAKTIKYYTNDEVVVDSSEKKNIDSFLELTKAQNDLTLNQIKKIAQKLKVQEFLLLILSANERESGVYEALLNKVDDIPGFKENLLEEMSCLLPQLISKKIEVTEVGFKSFLLIYEKNYSINPHKVFSCVSEALKGVTTYVSENRNKNYNLLRNKYNIEELLLQPFMFSKDYYRLIHPKYIEEEPKINITSQSLGEINNVMYLQQSTPFHHSSYVDLRETRKVQKITLFFPKINSTSFRPKIMIKISASDDSRERQIYYRYFHEEFLMQMGTYAFKDTQIFKGANLNSFVIADINVHTRFLKIEVSYNLLTTIIHSKYKEPTDDIVILPLISSSPSINQNSQKSQRILELIKKSYAFQPKNTVTGEKRPPSKYASSGDKFIYEVYEFPIIKMDQIKKQYTEAIERITTNIMDESIVRECVKNIKIQHYEFNVKGIDFCYTFLIQLMNYHKKFAMELHPSVDLMINLFETFVVYQIGPIMKKTYAYLQDSYKRLTYLEKSTFVETIINRYLTNIQKISETKLSDKFQVNKLLEKLQNFDLPSGLLFNKLEKNQNKCLKICLIKLISSNVQQNGLSNLEVYCHGSGKYTKIVTFDEIILICFKNCLWILDNVVGIREQALTQGINLWLLFLQNDYNPFTTEQRKKGISHFLTNFNQQQLWKLVFLTLKTKSEVLKDKIHKVFKVLIQNITPNFMKSINEMLLQIITKEEGSIYVRINPEISNELWMNHLQTTLQLISMTKSSIFLDVEIALKLLELPLTPTLWSLALHIIPREDTILISIIKNFKIEYYNSLGKEITTFCVPLAGIRSLESIHINWLDLVKKIRLQGKNIFQLFIEQLQNTSFGGKEGLTMATLDDVKQLEITLEFIKLVVEKEKQLKKEYFTDKNIKVLIHWYFINKTTEKGISPATDKILLISQNVKHLFSKMAEFQSIVPACIRIILEIRKQSVIIQRVFEEKRIPIHSALTLNKRFCECFEELLNVFMTNDELCSYFTFDINGLSYILQTIDLDSNKEVSKTSSISCLADQEVLIGEGLIQTKPNTEQAAINVDIKELEDLKEEEFANNVKIVPHLNIPNLVASNADWTVYKKANKTKIVFLPFADQNYHQHPLYIQLNKTIEIRSIKIGFPAASYDIPEKLVLSPSSVIIEGSTEENNFEPLGEMTYIPDEGYEANGIHLFVLNCQKIKGLSNINCNIKELQLHRVKYLKIVVKRPLITFLEGQYSPLNGKQYANIGSSISFLSVTGDDSEKLPFALIQSCKQISKKFSLSLLSNLMHESNVYTMKKIANEDYFSRVIQENFKRIKEYIVKYQDTMPNIVFLIGAGNQKLGDWIVEHFLKEGTGEIQAKIVNQIITSTPERIFLRLSLFQKTLMQKISLINAESDIQSGLLYNKEVFFMESFCKTLQECYEIGFQASGSLICTKKNIEEIINIYDRKNSSPEIKSLMKLLIYLIYLKDPLRLSEQLQISSMNLVWQNCSEAKPHFYNLMGSLLIDKKASRWIRQDNYAKIVSLVDQITKSIKDNQQKILKLQMFLLCQISYHEAAFLRERKVHIDLYNKLKFLTYSDNEVFDSLLKILRNIVLNYPQEQKQFALTLYDDVAILVKKRDPILQKFYVSLLGLQSEAMININGLDIQKSKKQVTINSKYLLKKHQKFLLQKLNKKFKFNMIGDITTEIRGEHQDIFLKAFNSGPSLLIIRFKYNEKPYTCGVYSSSSSRRNQQDVYYWEEVMNYEKTGFIFAIGDQEPFIIQSDPDKLLGNIFGGDEQQENGFSFFDESDQAIISHTFSHNSNEKSVPKINFTKHAKSFGNVAKTVFSSEDEDYQFIGIQLWELKALSQINATDNKLSNLLSKSNQAKAPFSFYRHCPIYIFPAGITIKKFMTILGISGTCKNKNIKLKEEVKLSQLEEQSNDFIIDLDILHHEEIKQEEEVSQIGYIPVMNIFNRFSELSGLNEVLRLGSESIKEWKKPDRKKNFQHYMEELKSFIHLPNFFNLFIKNHQYVTLIFQVASGLPDDPNNTRNWEEEYVNNFRFIYKIVSDIFKFDRSIQLRDMEKYSDFCDVILDKLAEISKEIVRVLKEDEEEPDTEENIIESMVIHKKKSEDKKRKKKGTGYGADNQNNSKWSSSEWLENRKNVSQQILRVITILVSFFDCEKPLEDDRLTESIKQSCLLPLLESALRSGSLLDISKESELFKSYLQIIRLLAANPATIQCLLDVEKKYKPEQTESIYNLLHKLNNIAEIFTECLKSGKEQKQSNQAAEGISLEIQRTHAIVDKAVKNMKKKVKVVTIKEIESMPISAAYRHLLSNYRFGYVNLKENGVFKHAHSSSISNSNPPTAKILRLSQELADLSSSLPCEHTNSIFVRCDRNRIDVINVLIMGSKDTPYSNGAFTFDVYCDDGYPNNPPKMLITTTGQGKIRFNPNLYSCGKVCLSLLGTWRGSASENWDPKLSTLLQLFISTQGITMSDDIYFNEPGFEGQQGTDEGDKKNQAYSNIVRLGNVRYAMNGQIKNPPKGFQDVVSRHFYIKKKQIIEECEKWIQYAEKRQASYNGLVNDHNSSWCAELKASKTKYKQLLVKQVEELKQLLAKIPPPNLKEKEDEPEVVNKREKKEQIVLKTKEIKLQEVDVGYENHNKEAKQYEQHVIHDRWSRYIGAMGLEAVKKQSESSVLLIGLKPLGLEIAKNLVLSGLKRLTIVDSDIIENHEEHFFMSNLKGNQIKDCIFKIKELNPYMHVDHSQTLPDVTKYTVVISTLTLEESLEISQKCHSEGIKFIQTQTCGVSGTFFADFGQKFQINDTNGQESFQGIIKNITNDEHGVVTLLEGVKHPYQDGDFIVFNSIQGLEVIKEIIEEKSEEQIFYEKLVNSKSEGFNGKIFKITVINWNSFSIGNTSNYGPYQGNGFCKNIKIPKKVQFKSLAECSKDFEKHLDPNLSIYDFEKMGDNLNIFLSFQALSLFKKSHKRLPKNWCLEDSKLFTKLIDELMQPYKKSEDEVKKALQFGQKFSYICQSELPTLGAYLGGLVSQEAIKGITNKFTPIKQFFTFHFNQLIQAIAADEKQIQSNHVKEQTSFRNLKIVVGEAGMQKIEESKTFVIGAGAIGCQLLKNFAMVNMGAKGEIVVTDPDHIETSNLSRQFLFREKHVKKAKSATACATLLQLNPQLEGHISARLDKICEETEEMYSNQFFKSRTLIANALDNVRARQYVDKRCVQNKIPLFESGTLGPKGHVQVIVPFKTQNYGSQNDPNQEAAIPVCTLKMFPQETIHCIEWARDIFGKMFTLNPKALKKVIDAKNLNEIQGQEKETVIKMVQNKPENFDDCIAEAVRKFNVYFRNNVRQLLYTYPIDMKTKEGKLFWQLPKRPPSEINLLEQNNQNHRTFISAYSVLLAKIYSIPYPQDFRKSDGKNKIMEIAKNVKVQDFVPNEENSKEIQKEVQKENNKEAKEQKIEEKIEEKPILIEKVQEFKLTADIFDIKMLPEQFEKDEDSNGHIDLIFSMANLRCKNYGLSECTWIEAKLKAGKIMAALSTTTSVVAALQTIEIIKLVVGSTNWRSAFINLALPLVQISEPGPPQKHKIGKGDFTVWEEWEFKATCLKDILDELKNKYEVEGYNISGLDGKPIYWQAMYKDKEEIKKALFEKKLNTMFEEPSFGLNIAMRNPTTGANYEHVPKIIVHVA